MEKISLTVKPLKRCDFASFGDVIEVDENRHHYPINSGSTERYHDLAKIDVLERDGRPIINIFRGQPFKLPIQVKLMERHPLSSQAFIPLDKTPYLIVVAKKENEELRANQLQAFISTGQQGINYHKGVWHHPLLSLEKVSDFLVLDRGGNEKNCDEFFFSNDQIITIDRLP